MKKRVAILGVLIIFGTAMALYNLRANTMPEIKFDLGKNIRDTARKSGAPKYSTRNVVGFISYGLVNLPHDIPARYVRAGYEIEALPLFAFTLYADEANRNNLAVEAAVLQYSTHEIKSHEAAQTFVEKLLTQFNNGKWLRYVPEYCPSVTGRSSYLNEAGELDPNGACPLDPQYRLVMSEWIQMMPMTQNYQWIGDGVLATLTVRSSDDIRGITYSIFLEFENISAKKRTEEENLARDLAEGDAQGWNSTAKSRAAELKRMKLIETLEQNAMKRGDKLFPR
ncbi:MAG: hypothetical protein ACXW3B_12465 [Telluria sp.]